MTEDFVIKNGVLKKYRGKDTDVVIPAGVTAIGDKAFSERSRIKRITVPEGVTKIGKYAFSECTSLTDIRLPDSLRIIGTLAFYWCNKIERIVIPENVICICEGAFSGCSSLTDITIPDSLTNIGKCAFCGCSGLADEDGFIVVRKKLYGYEGYKEDITIPDGVEVIGERAFYLTDVTSVSISEGVKAIEDYAFESCDTLKTVIFPKGLISIGNDSFFECTSLREVHIPYGLKYIGKEAFGDCSALETVTLPDSLLHIGSYAFSHCTSLRKVTIPDSVVLISEGAFADCTSLCNITIPESVRKIDECAFSACSSLKDVVVLGERTDFEYDSFGSDSDVTLISRNGNPEAVRNLFDGIPDKLKLFLPNIIPSHLPDEMIKPALLGFIEKYGTEPIHDFICEEYYELISKKWKSCYTKVINNPALFRELIVRRLISLRNARFVIDKTDDIELKASLIEYCNNATDEEKAQDRKSAETEYRKAFGLKEDDEDDSD